MTSPTLSDAVAAQLLLEQVPGHDGDAEERASAVGIMHDALFAALEPILGVVGAQALFMRSVRLTEPAFPCLGSALGAAGASSSSAEIRVALVRALRELPADSVSEAAVAVYAHLWALLSRFLGEPLTCRIAKLAFPTVDVGFTNIAAEETP